MTCSHRNGQVFRGRVQVREGLCSPSDDVIELQSKLSVNAEKKL